MSKNYDDNSHVGRGEKRARGSSFYINPENNKVGIDSGKTASAMVDAYNEIITSEEDQKGDIVDRAKMVSKSLGRDAYKISGSTTIRRIKSFNSFANNGISQDASDTESVFWDRSSKKNSQGSIDSESDKREFRKAVEKEVRDEYLEENETKEFTVFINEDSQEGEFRRNFLDDVLQQKSFEKRQKDSSIKYNKDDDKLGFLKSVYNRNHNDGQGR